MIYAMLLAASFLLGVMFATRKRRGEVLARRRRLRETVDELVPPPLTGEIIRSRVESHYQGVAFVHPCPLEGTEHAHAPGGACIHTVEAFLAREGFVGWEPRWDAGAKRFGFVRPTELPRKERRA